ncbi:hypothetical protein Hdeb2414_s0003g00103071 [Helianthus debilis subsp. tardiflorus]
MKMECVTDFPMSTVHIGPRKLQSNLRRYDDHHTRHNGPLSRTPNKWRNQEELSTKITMDFVSPENIQQCIRLTEELCKLPVNHKAKEDKLEVVHEGYTLCCMCCLYFFLIDHDIFFGKSLDKRLIISLRSITAIKHA